MRKKKLKFIFLSSQQAQQSPSQMCLDSFQSGILAATNNYRTLHHASVLTTDTTIITYAQNYANFLMSISGLQHSVTSYGENLYYYQGQKIITINNVQSVVCGYQDNAADCKSI